MHNFSRFKWSYPQLSELPGQISHKEGVIDMEVQNRV